MPRFFLDSNIAIYCFDEQSPRKQNVARELMALGKSNAAGVISYQVIQEFLNVALSSRRLALSQLAALTFVEQVLEPINKVDASFDLFASAVALRSETKYAFYDCLIVGAALQSHCETLYSEDMQHNQRIGSLRIVNPFLEAVNELA